ncbi:DNA polymerase-3 subunit delta [Gracilibacillus halotolerans]|uniref:DNA polymerase III subunit delta n=1 Tax=Gracilibacillus halotolerans TaxID=74386 RepID=A0A841RKX3_9BACI|nr:DNA polymerase III subunit delta [Gracilibacillus halotolerans]MBB6511845.1 DNA polymerase-3 subunit delta [Gracilibacillus halotolerans]
MDYLECMQQIKKDKIAPVYYLYGTENYMTDMLRATLTKKIVEPEDLDTNLSTYDLEETTIQEVIIDAETFPFFGERKLIIAHNADFLKAKPSVTDILHQPESLITYLENPAPYTVLVVIAPYEKVDERKKIVKALKKHAAFVECQPLKEYNMQQTVKTLANDLHITVSNQVVDFLIETIGSNLMVIQSELEKMALYAGAGNEIQLETAKLLISEQENSTAFQLVDAVLTSDLKAAINIKKDLEKKGEDPIGMLALITSQFRTILQVKVLKQKGYTQQQIAQQLKIHPYTAKLALNRQASFTFAELKKMIDKMAETDLQMKTGAMDKSIAFELLLYYLIQERHKNNTKPSLA